MTQALINLKVILWIIPAVYFFFVAAEFQVMTQLAFTLTRRGHTALEVGIVASAMWVGIFLSSLFAHRIVDRQGYGPSFVGGCAVAMLAMASTWLHAHYAGWLLGALMLGMAGGIAWVAGESWLAEAAPADRRGFFVGLFETSVGVGMVLGPVLILAAKAVGIDPLKAGTAMMALGLASSLLLLPHSPPPHLQQEEPDPLTREQLFAIALPLSLVATVSGLLEAGSLALLPALSLRIGFDASQAAFLGAVIGAGSALMQAPMGALSDRVGMRRSLAGSWLVLLAAIALLWWRADQPGWALWVLGFVLGGVGGAIYTLVVIELGHRLGRGALVRAMGLLVSTYTAGTAAGPSLGGWLFDQGGMALLSAALFMATAIGALFTLRIKLGTGEASTQPN
jgi:MFS family permease